MASDIADRFGQIISDKPTDEQLSSYDTLLKVASNLPNLYSDIKDSLANVVYKNLN